jgi:hypothetical protein
MRSGLPPCLLVGNSVRVTIIVNPPPIGEAENSSTDTVVAVVAIGRQIDENG